MAMTRQEIEKITNEFLIEEIEIDADAIAQDARLKEDLGVDSLDFVDIVVIVERNFGFKIKAEEMAGVTTLGAFYDYIEKKVNG
ncbi:MAG: Acyl carrier protein [Bacteroidetes bacterium ADurb.Bin217]|nr:MAG: Acyl carrier protein [Bacteroidetes bacterium ADurb.Bin217]